MGSLSLQFAATGQSAVLSVIYVRAPANTVWRWATVNLANQGGGGLASIVTQTITQFAKVTVYP
jgi:hypothetical protein